MLPKHGLPRKYTLIHRLYVFSRFHFANLFCLAGAGFIDRKDHACPGRRRRKFVFFHYRFARIFFRKHNRSWKYDRTCDRRFGTANRARPYSSPCGNPSSEHLLSGDAPLGRPADADSATAEGFYKCHSRGLSDTRHQSNSRAAADARTGFYPSLGGET